MCLSGVGSCCWPHAPKFISSEFFYQIHPHMSKALPLLSMGENIFTAFSGPLHASVCIAKGDTGPRHLFNWIMNNVHEAPVSVGEHSNVKKFLRTRKIMVMHSNVMEECVHVPS